MCDQCNVLAGVLKDKQAKRMALLKQYKKLNLFYKELLAKLGNALTVARDTIAKCDGQLGQPLPHRAFGYNIGMIDSLTAALKVIGSKGPIAPNYTLKAGGSIGRGWRGFVKAIGQYR